MEKKAKQIPDNINHYKQLKNGEYLGHWDIPKGKEVPVKISSIQLEEMYNPGSHQTEENWCASFEGKAKRMVLNTTNMGAIASWHGEDPHGWLGKEVKIFRTHTKVKGVPTECLRIKNKNDDANEKGKNATGSAGKLL